MLCRECYEIPPTMPPAERILRLNRESQRAAQDPSIQRLARALYTRLATRLGRAPTSTETLQELMDAIHLLVDYVPDPPGREIFQTVRSTLSNGLGRGISPLTGQLKGGDDCEGLAAAVVALGLVLGLNMGNHWYHQEGAALNHVAAEACDGGPWPTHFGRCIPIETTIPGARPGETPYDVLRRIGPAHKERIFG